MQETLSIVSKHWDEALAICLAGKRDDSEYVGERVTPARTARSAFQSQSLNADSTVDEVAEEIHSSARTEWIYRDRENRG